MPGGRDYKPKLLKHGQVLQRLICLKLWTLFSQVIYRLGRVVCLVCLSMFYDLMAVAINQTATTNGVGVKGQSSSASYTANFYHFPETLPHLLPKPNA
jgi:hypothetical protein